MCVPPQRYFPQDQTAINPLVAVTQSWPRVGEDPAENSRGAGGRLPRPSGVPCQKIGTVATGSALYRAPDVGALPHGLRTRLRFCSARCRDEVPPSRCVTRLRESTSGIYFCGSTSGYYSLSRKHLESHPPRHAAPRERRPVGRGCGIGPVNAYAVLLLQWRCVLL